MNNEIKKILVFETAHIGDYILTMPAIKTLKKNFPDAEITLVAGPWNEGVAKATPWVDNVIIFENPFIERGLNLVKMAKISILKNKVLREFFSNLREVKYDLVVVFSDRKFHRLLLPFIRANKKLFRGDLEPSDNHELDVCLRVLGPLKLRKEYRMAEPEYSQKDGGVVKELLSGLSRKKKIVMHPIGGTEERSWPAEKWSALISNLLKENKGQKFMLVGAPDDKKELDKIVEGVGDKGGVVNLAGETNLVQLFLLIRESDLFVGVNSGPMHMAVLVGTPVAGLIGPPTINRWLPCGKRDRFIKSENLNEIQVEEMVALVNSKNEKIKRN